jgi:hypothetical protein
MPLALSDPMAGEAVASENIASGPPTDLIDNLSAAWDSSRVNDRYTGERQAVEDVYDQYNEQVKRETGIDLPNPERGELPPDSPLRQALMDDPRIPMTLEVTAPEYERYAQTRGVKPLTSEQAFERAHAGMYGAETQLGSVASRSGTTGTGVARFLGSTAAITTDPPVLTSMLFGGGEGSLLRTMAREAVSAGITETMIQPQIQSARQRAGLPGGFEQGAENVAMASGGAAALSAAFRGVGVAYRSLRNTALNFKPRTAAELDTARYVERYADLQSANPLVNTPEAAAEHVDRVSAAQTRLYNPDPAPGTADLPDAPANPTREDAIGPAGQAPESAPSEALPAEPPYLAQHGIGAPSPSGQPGVGDLWQLEPSELESLLQERGASDRAKLVQALGGEAEADAFQRADRARNSSDSVRADRAATAFDEKYGNLTPDQQRLVYGIGESDVQADDVQTVLKAHQDVQGIADDGSKDWAAYVAGLGVRKASAAEIRAVPDGGGTPAAQAAYVRLRGAVDAMQQAGVAADDIPKTIGHALMGRGGWTGAQVNELVGGFFQDAAAQVPARSGARGALTAPGATKPPGFTTAKGSRYELHPDGTTTRNKAARPEHPGANERGLQPRSETTHFVDKADVEKLALFQTQGPKKALVSDGKGSIGIKYLEGKDAGKIERSTVVPTEPSPRVGAVPVETWNGGQRVHFGNDITAIDTAPRAASVGERSAQVSAEVDALRAVSGETGALQRARRLGDELARRARESAGGRDAFLRARQTAADLIQSGALDDAHLNAARGPRPTPPSDDPSLVQFVINRGGVSDSDRALAQANVTARSRPGLISRTGMSVGRMAELAHEAGYFPDAQPGEGSRAIDQRELATAIRDELDGQRLYARHGAGGNPEARAAYEDALRAHGDLNKALEGMDIDPKGMTNDDIREAVDSVAQSEAPEFPERPDYTAKAIDEADGAARNMERGPDDDERLAILAENDLRARFADRMDDSLFATDANGNAYETTVRALFDALEGDAKLVREFAGCMGVPF